MPFLSIARITNSEFDINGTKWMVQAAGRTIVGSAWDRPKQFIGTDACYLSIKRPIYLADIGWSGLASTIVITETAVVGNCPAGVIKVKEVFFRASTGERSAGGEATSAVLAGGFQIKIKSNAPVASTENLVTHREFYVAYATAPDAYYLWQQIPYTGTAVHDETTANSLTFEQLQLRRPLESGGETGLFPAVASAAYRFGALVGAGQRDRQPLSCNIVFTQNSAIVTMTGSNTFNESDHLRSIIYTGPTFDSAIGRRIYQNETIAVIDQVLTPTKALVVFPDANTLVWPLAQFTMINLATTATSTFNFSGRGKSSLFASPNYVGEAYAGLTRAQFSFTVLNTIRDSNLEDRAGRATFVAGCGADLVVGFEHGMSLVQSEFTVDNPPDYTFIPLSEEVGTINQRSFWQDNDRNVMFQANDRWWAVQGTRVVEISKAMGVSSFARKYLYGVTGATLKDQRVVFNSERNSVLTVGLTKSTDLIAAKGTYGLMICNDGVRPTLHPLRFASAVYCGATSPREKLGLQFNQWFTGGVSGAIYLLEDPGALADTTALASTDIPWYMETGDIMFEWRAIIKQLYILFENAFADYNVTVTIKAHRSANLLSPTSLPAMTVTKDTLDYQMAQVWQDQVRGVRIRIAGQTSTGGMGLFKIQFTAESVEEAKKK